MAAKKNTFNHPKTKAQELSELWDELAKAGMVKPRTPADTDNLQIKALEERLGQLPPDDKG